MLRYFEVLKFRSNAFKDRHRARLAGRFLPFSFGITRVGVLYMACIFGLSWAAIKTGNNLLVMILSVLLSTIAVSGIVSRNSLRGVSLALQMPENVFVGERVSIRVTMKNRKRIFPSFSIRVEDPGLARKQASIRPTGRLPFLRRIRPAEASGGDRAAFRQAAYFPILRPKEARSELLVQSFPRRGLYRLQGFWISTRFPFGLFRRGERIGAQGDVLVYPSVQEVSSFFHLLPFLPGRLEGLHAGPGENLFSIRKYQQAESARIIDWKATAKTGELMAREYARDEESKFCLILDTRLDAHACAGSEGDFEKAVSLAAGIAAHFLREGAGIEFLTPDAYMPRGTGIDHLYRILRLLAVAECTRISRPASSGLWRPDNFPGVEDASALRQILSDKVFKIILTSMPRGAFPSAIWRSSRVIFFDEL